MYQGKGNYQVPCFCLVGVKPNFDLVLKVSQSSVSRGSK